VRKIPQTGQQEAAETAALGARQAQAVAREQPGEKLLRAVLRGVVIATLPAGEGIKWIPATLAQQLEGGVSLRVGVRARTQNERPLRRRERSSSRSGRLLTVLPVDRRLR
jgi:hypothetical protein